MGWIKISKKKKLEYKESPIFTNVMEAIKWLEINWDPEFNLLSFEDLSGTDGWKYVLILGDWKDIDKVFEKIDAFDYEDFENGKNKAKYINNLKEYDVDQNSFK
jgi:hypothetical protein